MRGSPQRPRHHNSASLLSLTQPKLSHQEIEIMAMRKALGKLMRSEKNLGFSLGLFIAIWLISALTTPWSANTQGAPVVTVSAASYAPIVAPDSMAAAFGSRLATRAEGAQSITLPTSIAGTTVRVNGELSRLLYVSPGQVNYLIPSGTALGVASIVVTSGDGTVSTGSAQIALVAPGLFTVGQSALASLALRVKADGQQIYESLVRFDGTNLVTRPIDFGEAGDRIFLVLYLTGIRHAPPSGVRVSIGGFDYTPAFVGAGGGYEGLEQINLELPRDFGGRGRISLFVKAAGYGASNVCEFEVGSGTESLGTLQINPPAQAVLAGEVIEISGAGFAANPRENKMQIVADDGVSTNPEVLA